MRRLAGIGVVLVVVLALGIGQLVLPGIAAHRLRTQLAHDGTVQSVSVHAFPAITLLWHHADRVTIRMDRYHAAATGSLTDRLGQLHDVGTLHATAQTVTIGRLTVHDARLVKSGHTLTGTATATSAGLRNVLPILTSVTPVASVGGALTLRGTADVLGLPVSAEASVRAVGGALVVVPDVPFGGLVTTTLFSDPRLVVTGVSAAPAAAGALAMTATARLR